MVRDTVEAFGGLDGAFNNAGIGPASVLHEKSADEWQKVIDVNLTGIFYCLKHEVRYMLGHGGGSIVNTSSEAGAIALPGVPAYVTSKHGVVGVGLCETRYSCECCAAWPHQYPIA